MATTPTQLSLKYLRNLCYPLIEVVERWNAFSRTRKDLFGIIDILAVDEQGQILAVQATSRANISARVKKMKQSESLPLLLLAGWNVEVWGWEKRPSGRWEMKAVPLNKGDQE